MLSSKYDVLIDCHKYCPESLYQCWLRLGLVRLGLSPLPRKLFYPVFVYLSLCLLTTSVRATTWIVMKILPEMCLWTRKSWLNFGSHPWTGSRRLWGILQHCEIGHFSTIWLISLENWSVLRENFSTDVFSDKKVPGTFRKSSGLRIRIWTLDPQSRSGVWIRFALVCALQVLLLHYVCLVIMYRIGCLFHQHGWVKASLSRTRQTALRMM